VDDALSKSRWPGCVIAAQGERFDLVLGRRTYDLWSSFWPKAPSSPMADVLNAAKKYVATHRPESLEWGPFEGVGPDIIASIRRIKSQDGPNLILCGQLHADIDAARSWARG
jgi:dihydrofolate reductase